VFDVFQQISCNFVAGSAKKQQAINLMAIVWDGLVAKKFVLKDTNTSRNRRWNMKDITNVTPSAPPVADDSGAGAVPKISNDECLYCMENGTLLVCEYLGCPLVAHGECDGLNVKETKRLMKSPDPWFCPNHRPPRPNLNPLPEAPASDASAAVGVIPGAAAAADQAQPDPPFNPIPDALPADHHLDPAAAPALTACEAAAPVAAAATADFASAAAATTTTPAPAAAATTTTPAPAGKSSAAVGQAITFVSLSETLGFLSMRCGEGLLEEVPNNLQTALDELKKMIEMHLSSKQVGGVAAAAPQHLVTESPMQSPLAGVAIIASAPGPAGHSPPAILQSAAVPFKTAADRSSNLKIRVRQPPQDRDSTPTPATKRRHVGSLS
jgi:hypothetical protein